MPAMILSIVKAKQEAGKYFDFDINVELNQKFVEDKNYKFLTPARVRGKMCYVNEILHIQAKVEFSLMAICDCCGEEFERHFSFDFNESFVESFNSTNSDDYLINQTWVEIEKPVEDVLLLNLPTKMLCRQNCKGLCPICGKNLNNFSCNCQQIEKELEIEESPFKTLQDNNK